MLMLFYIGLYKKCDITYDLYFVFKRKLLQILIDYYFIYTLVLSVWRKIIYKSMFIKKRKTQKNKIYFWLLSLWKEQINCILPLIIFNVHWLYEIRILYRFYLRAFRETFRPSWTNPKHQVASKNLQTNHCLIINNKFKSTPLSCNINRRKHLHASLTVTGRIFLSIKPTRQGF